MPFKVRSRIDCSHPPAQLCSKSLFLEGWLKMWWEGLAPGAARLKTAAYITTNSSTAAWATLTRAISLVTSNRMVQHVFEAFNREINIPLSWSSAESWWLSFIQSASLEPYWNKYLKTAKVWVLEVISEHQITPALYFSFHLFSAETVPSLSGNLEL